jgi:hypothetical protein
MRAAKFLTTTALAAVLAGTAAQADVTISSKPTENMSCAQGVCTATAKRAVLNVGDLASMLSGGDVKVAGDKQAKDIEIDASLSWVSASRLTLDAYRSISFNKPVVVAGTGALTITTNDGGANGDFGFTGKGHVEFWDLSSSLVINGNSYSLVKKLKDLKSAIKANPTGLFALAGDYNAQKDGTYGNPAISYLGGMIEGLGNRIQYLTMSTPGKVQFAPIKRSDGTIRDLGLTNVNVNATNITGAAGLVFENDGTILNCYVTGTVEGGDGAAGLAFDNGGTISHSHTAVDVAVTGQDGNRFAGGLVGGNSGLIETSYATGSVTGSDAGGLVGVNGGVNGGTVTQSFATGAVSSVAGGSPVGGLVGRNENTITNSYATGAVSGGGGAVGTNDGAKIDAVYSTGFVNAFNGGGLVYADITQTFTNSYWDLDTSGINDPGQGAGNIRNDPGITGLTTQQFQSGLPQGFDSAIWAENPKINSGYPYLRAAPPPQ